MALLQGIIMNRYNGAHILIIFLGKVVLVTGSSRGIGRACAIQSATHGASALVLHYFGDEITTQEVKSLQNTVGQLDCKSIVVPGDISEPQTSVTLVDEAIKAFGRIGEFPL
jgi:L-rhamnose 1-dehydrogenase